MKFDKDIFKGGQIGLFYNKQRKALETIIHLKGLQEDKGILYS